YGKATVGRPRSEPDWGKPTVRDRRGACGNVDHGGTRHPPRVSKERVLETLRLKLCAPQIYPDPGPLVGQLAEFPSTPQHRPYGMLPQARCPFLATLMRTPT